MKIIGSLLACISLAAIASLEGPAPALPFSVVQAGPAAAGLQAGPDRLVAGIDVDVEDTVSGDLMASGAVVSVKARVDGDVLSAGGSVTASGPIAGSFRAAGGKVTLAGAVGRNVTLAGGSVRVASTATVDGNAYLAGGEVVIEGSITGNLRASAETVRIMGAVAGPVEVRAERVVIGPDAHLAAGLSHDSPDPAEVVPGARIDGTVMHEQAGGPLRSWIGGALKIARFLLTGVVLVALFPGTFVRLRNTLRERPWPSMGFGLATLVVVPIALILAAVTVLGLPLALIGAALFVPTLYVARTVVAVWLGDRLLDGGPERGPRVVAFLVGGTVLLLVGLLPWIGWAVTLLATLAGLGAVAASLISGWRRGSVAGGSG